MFKDYYAILEVDIQASQQDIKSAYYFQCKKWHPDKNPNQDTTQIMQDINEAYLILKVVEGRQKYNVEYLRFRQYHQKTQREETSFKQKQTHRKSEYSYSDYTFHLMIKFLKNGCKMQRIELRK